jgi:hypothetical protein
VRPTYKGDSLQSLSLHLLTRSWLAAPNVHPILQKSQSSQDRNKRRGYTLHQALHLQGYELTAAATSANVGKQISSKP